MIYWIRFQDVYIASLIITYTRSGAKDQQASYNQQHYFQKKI